MPDSELLREYSNSIKNLKKQCREAGMRDDEFRKMYFQSLKALETSGQMENSRRRIIAKYIVLVIGTLLGLYVVCQYKTVYSTIMCNVQEYIYPGLKLLRRIMIPFISLFPSLTDFYHETCLIQNPFFTVVDMDCWPCSTVTNVIEVDDPKPVSKDQSAPFIYETEQQVINMESLKRMYLQNKETFMTESPKILTNNKFYQTPDDIFNPSYSDENIFYVWKFNSIKVANLLRQVIPRPKVVPKFGQSIERFLVIDNSQRQFSIPDTECSFSFLLALSGTRDIQLLPAEECKHQCKALIVELKETYLLWYNWWYWRPAVQPSMGNQTFIAHVGSYC